MRRMMRPFLFAVAALLTGAGGAQAHDTALLTNRPYVIEKTCKFEYRGCKVRMNYAPGQHAGLAGSGSYWYRKAHQYSWGISHNHAAWCAARYRTYDPYTDTYVGKSYKRKHCRSPYRGW